MRFRNNQWGFYDEDWNLIMYFNYSTPYCPEDISSGRLFAKAKNSMVKNYLQWRTTKGSCYAEGKDW